MLLWLQFSVLTCTIAVLIQKAFVVIFLVKASSQAVQSYTVRHFYASEYIFLHSSLLEIKLQQTWWVSPSCMIQYINNHTDAEITALVVCSCLQFIWCVCDFFCWNEMVITQIFSSLNYQDILIKFMSFQKKLCVKKKMCTGSFAQKINKISRKYQIN